MAVGVLEAGLEVAFPGRQGQQGGEVPTGRAPAHGHEARVAAVAVDVVPHPGDGPLAVHDVGRPGVLRAQPVIDGHPHPAAPGQLEEEGQTLLALVADDPGPAVDVHEHRGVLGRVGAPHDHIEAMGAPAVAPVVDVADGPGRPGGTRQRVDEPGEAPHGVAAAAGELDARHGRERHLLLGLGQHVVGPVRVHGVDEEADPGSHGDGEPQPPRPRPESAEVGEDGGGRRLPDDVPDGHLGGVPTGEEALDDEEPGPRGPEGVQDQQRPEGADGQIRPGPGHRAVRHGTILAEGARMRTSRGLAGDRLRKGSGSWSD